MSNKKPMILVLAGPNGSGKSTITQYFEKVGTYTNADDVVAATGISNEDAAKLVDEKRYKSIEQKEDFTFETVLSSNIKLDILEKARVASGGHDVDREKIIARYYKSLDNIKHLIELCDILHVYDNTIEPIRIIRKHKKDISIFPNEFWSEDKILGLIEEAVD